MSTQRIGTTEGMDIPGINVVPVISLAVGHNGIVSLCGMTADPIGDVKVQTRQVLERIAHLLQMTGADRIETFGPRLANMRDLEDHNSGWNDWVDDCSCFPRLLAKHRDITHWPPTLPQPWMPGKNVRIARLHALEKPHSLRFRRKKQCLRFR